MEVWKPAQDYPGYEVSSLGRVRKDDYVLATHLISGRPRVSLRLNRKGIKRQVVRLVANAFDHYVGDNPSIEPVYRDGDPANLAASNVYWAPAPKNPVRIAGIDEIRGEKNIHAVLTAETVLEIRAALEAGKTLQALATHYGISISHVNNIGARRRWAHI